ncbi:MAG: DapH/DapD/GlmU-related protein [Pseudobdellovibrio sp.]
MQERIDINETSSKHSGLKGLFEVLLRRFKVVMHILTMIPVYFFACFVLAIALVPSVSFFRWTASLVAEQNFFFQSFVYALSFATGYFVYGFTLVFVAPAVNFVCVGRLKEWRGPYYSFESLRWFLHNGLTYLLRFTFLEFITPSPLGLMFYKMMGMKIGKGVQINSTWISDPSLVEIGEKSTIGGSATLVAHYGQGGLLIIAPVKIGAGCTIGLKATIMGGVVIGDGAKILPMSVLLPKTVVPPGETWGGVPAQKVELKKI